MDPNRKTDRILSEWDALAHTARRPATAPRRRGALAGLGSALGLAGAGVLAAALVVAVAWLGGRISPSVGALPPASATTAPIVGASVAPSAKPAATASPSKRPAATATPVTEAGCTRDELTARITAWEGAAGSRIADVTVRNTSSSACRLPAAPPLQLVDGSGRVLIDGGHSASTGTIQLAAAATVTTLVDVSNYCGAPATPPVRITFDLGASGRLVATPPTPTDDTVPPCNGSTVAASIQMQPWSRS
jgi:Protein of unknown function (DUF4232)